MTGGISLGKTLFFCSALLFAMPLKGTDVPLYWNDESNLVAAVVSYEREAILQNGEKVRLFSTDIDGKYTNFQAVVFQVVSPRKFSGWFFRLINAQNAWGTAEGILPLKYRIGEMYYFPIQTVSLFRIDAGTQEPADTVLKNPGRKYFTDSKIAENQLRELESRVKSLKEAMARLGVELKNEPIIKGSAEHFLWRKKKGRYWDLKHTIQGLETRKEEIQRQIIYLKMIEEGHSAGKDKP